MDRTEGINISSASALRDYSTPLAAKMLIVLLVLLFPVISFAQEQPVEDLPSPRGAFLRSLVVPGWGHYYADSDNWNRGKYHLAAEAVLVISYFGLNARANDLENGFYSFARSNAGANLDNKTRDYLIAVGNYDNLKAYNDAQLQLRNWNGIYPETAEYNWNWESRDLRNQYRNTREQVDKNRGQLPTLLALMFTNRILSGISSFIHARDLMNNVPEAGFSYVNDFGEPGIVANVRINF